MVSPRPWGACAAAELTVGLSNPGPLTTEFDFDHRLIVEEPPSRPASPTEFDADQEYQVVHPPAPSPGSASPTKPDYEMVDVPPSSSVSSTNPERQSMGAGSHSQLENLQAVSDALKGNAKESRHISGTARDVLDVAQRELQRVRSRDPGE
jgi:hypothetical protein